MSSDLLLASASEDLRLWTYPNLNLNSVRANSERPIKHCSCSPNGQLVAYSHEGKDVTVGNLHNDTAPIVVIPTQFEQSSVCFNGNCRYLLSGGSDGVITVWDIKTQTVKRVYNEHVDPVTFCIFNFNDAIIASGSNRGKILLTNVQNGNTDNLDGPDNQSVRSMQYSFFSRHLLATISESGALCLWDCKEHRLLKHFTEHHGPGTDLTFSPLNDMLLCSTGLDKKILFYDVVGKKCVKTINTEVAVTCCEFMHDGATVCVGSLSGKIYIFDLRQGSTPVKVIPAHQTSVNSVSFQKIPKERNKGSSRPSSESASKSYNNTPSQCTPSTHPSILNGTPIYTITQSSVTSTVTPVVPMSRSLTTLATATPSNAAPQMNPSITASKPPVYNKSHTASEISTKTGIVATHVIKDPSITLTGGQIVGNSQTPNNQRLASTIDVFSPITSEIAALSIPDVPNNRKFHTISRINSIPKDAITPDFVPTDLEESSQDFQRRPVFPRSKSGLSQYSLTKTSNEDLSKISKSPEKYEVGSIGKKSGGRLSGFKSPFKKRTSSSKELKDKQSGYESDNCSVESYVMNDEKSGFREKLSRRLSIGSTKSDGADKSSVQDAIKLHKSKDESQTRLLTSADYNVSIDSYQSSVDKKQLLQNVQNSLSNLQRPRLAHTDQLQRQSVKSGNIEIQEQNLAPNTNSPLQFQVDFIKSMIEEALEDTRDAIHADIVNLQVDMYRLMEIQKNQFQQMLEQHSINDELVAEIERLREENIRLKTKY